MNLPSLDPVPRLLERVRFELTAAMDAARPMRISRAPGRLDVIGGIADYTGSLVCEATLDLAAAVALQTRQDRLLQVFSFNLHDAHLPFTFGIDLGDLAAATDADLRAGFDEPGRKWAAYIAGCLFVLHEQGMIDLADPAARGINLALLSTVPLGAGVSSSAAIEVATMINLIDHFNLRGRIDPMALASLCQQVENRIVGAPSGIMDQVTSCLGESGMLLRLICQPHDLQPPLRLPDGVRAIGIDSGVRHDVGGEPYRRTRCAAFMGHKIILEKMRQMGAASGRTLQRDPMGGYLANLDPNDYKKYFRPYLPESIKGGRFLLKYRSTIDTATRVEPDVNYAVQGAADHHVSEARRVRQFTEFIEQADALPAGSRQRTELLDKAGHLMYASHHSYTHDAMLGDDACDLLVQLVRQREPDGFYGAKITGGGCGGTVAVLARTGERTDRAIDEIIAEYQRRTGRQARAFTGTGPGAWAVGTYVKTP